MALLCLVKFINERKGIFMNWVLIGVAVFLIICAFSGYYMGLIKKLFRLFSFIVTIIAATAMTPYISDFIVENTSIYNKIESNISGMFTELYDDKDNEGKSGIDKAESSMPDIISDILLEGEAKEMIVEEINDYFSSQAARIIVNSISFFAAFVVIQIILRTTVFTLDIITNLPIIKGINQYAGLALGLCEGIVWVWIFFLIVMFIGTSEIGIIINSQIRDSEFLSYLYNNNYLYKIFT